MANDNNTVIEIVNDMRGSIYSVSRCPNLEMLGYADRIETAHNREIAAKDAEIAELQRTLDLHDLYADEECEDADTARIVAEEETAEKDAEIAELRECLKEASGLQLRCESCKVKHCDSICMLKLKWRKALEGGNDAR